MVAERLLVDEMERSKATGVFADLAREADSLKAESSRIEEEIRGARTELDTLWLEDRKEEYELSSVFMHRGELWRRCIAAGSGW
jgi:hypothetical protein